MAFPAEFYQNFWDIIKDDLLELFVELHVGQLELFHINYGDIILLLKVMLRNGFNNIDQYVFLMSFFKILTKVATIRLNLVSSRGAPYLDRLHARSIYSGWSCYFA
jgi:hypothetical protein